MKSLSELMEIVKKADRLPISFFEVRAEDEHALYAGACGSWMVAVLVG